MTDTPTSSACRGCGHALLERVYRAVGVPVHSCVLLDDPDEARRFPTGDVALDFCVGCGLLQNTRFDEAAVDYSAGYEDSQAHSERWVAWARGLATDLIERHDLHGRHALEVGCGKGDFLALLADAGGMTGTGYDPAFRPGPLVSSDDPRLRFVRERYSGRTVEAADLVSCRHTLEHVADPAGLLGLLAETAARRDCAVVFIEVPDTIRILEEAAFWDIYYEHSWYFTPGSLARLCRACGLEVVDLRTGYDGQYVLLEAVVGAAGAPRSAEEDLERLATLVDGFRTQVPARLARLRAQLDAIVGDGRRVVLWGASSKAVSYLTTLAVGAEVAGVVDISPAKRGRFLAGTGHRVLGPVDLPEVRPDVVLLMNPVYADEVAGILAACDVRAEVRTLDEPARPRPDAVAVDR